MRKWVKTQDRKDKGKGFRQKDGTIQSATSPAKIGQAYKVPDSVLRIFSEKTRGIHTRGHPAVFPAELPKFALGTWPSQTIFEPFSGAGTTIIASEELGRDCRGIEIDPAYCDVAIQRWQNFTGLEATLVATGQSYADVAAARILVAA